MHAHLKYNACSYAISCKPTCNFNHVPMQCNALYHVMLYMPPFNAMHAACNAMHAPCNAMHAACNAMHAPMQCHASQKLVQPERESMACQIP